MWFADIAEQLGGPIENDIYGPAHRFSSRTNASRIVQGDVKLVTRSGREHIAKKLSR